FLQAWLRQYERAPRTSRQCLDRRNVAVIAVVVSDKRDVEFGRKFIGREWGRLKLLGGFQIQISADQNAIRLDKPSGIAHPPNRETLMVRLDVLQNCAAGRPEGLRRCGPDGPHPRAAEQSEYGSSSPHLPPTF